jgi:hypothetical protein
MSPMSSKSLPIKVIAHDYLPAMVRLGPTSDIKRADRTGTVNPPLNGGRCAPADRAIWTAFRQTTCFASLCTPLIR